MDERGGPSVRILEAAVSDDGERSEEGVGREEAEEGEEEDMVREEGRHCSRRADGLVEGDLLVKLAASLKGKISLKGG